MALLVIYAVGQGPWRKYQQSATSLAAAQRRLGEVRNWHKAVLEARRDRETLGKFIAQRGQNFDLYTFMSSLLGELELQTRAELRSDRVAASEDFSGVQIALSGVNMKEIVDLLHRICSSNNLIVLHSLEYLHPADDGAGLDFSAKFFSPKG
jgi:hypothetical protein